MDTHVAHLNRLASRHADALTAYNGASNLGRVVVALTLAISECRVADIDPRTDPAVQMILEQAVHLCGGLPLEGAFDRIDAVRAAEQDDRQRPIRVASVRLEPMPAPLWVAASGPLPMHDGSIQRVCLLVPPDRQDGLEAELRQQVAATFERVHTGFTGLWAWISAPDLFTDPGFSKTRLVETDERLDFPTASHLHKVASYLRHRLALLSV